MRISLVALGFLLTVAPHAFAAGVESCGNSKADSANSTAAISAPFTPYRSGTKDVDFTARDIEMMWDQLYGPLLLDGTQTFDNFVRSMVVTTGTNPTATNATNLQAVYNTLRREGADWNPTNASDSTSFRVGRDFESEVVAGYLNADRAHADVYLPHPSRVAADGVPDGKFTSAYVNSNEDVSTDHALGDVKHLNSVHYKGPDPANMIDLTGTGWTSPTSPWRLYVSHEIAHSFPPGDAQGGPLTELWSAAAEALNGLYDTAPSNEVSYTWSLLADEPHPSAFPSCTEIRRSRSNYLGRTSFMAYVAYNFLNADSNRTLAGSQDDLLTRWAKLPGRNVEALQTQLSDANCPTCATRSYFRNGATPLSNRDRLNVLLHNWRVANFVNSPTLAERQFGYPTWSGFSPAANQRAWQSFDGCATDDIVALPAILTLNSRQLTRDTLLTGTRSFRGATYPLSLTALGSNYWVIRADASLSSANRELVIRVVPEGIWRCDAKSLALMGSAVAYSIPDASGDASILWQNPAAASLVTPIQSTDVGDAMSPIEIVIPNFGLSNKSAVLVLSTADGANGGPTAVTGLGYAEALPYRLEVGFRAAPFMTAPQTVSARPEKPEGMPTWSPTGNELAYYSLDSTVSSNIQIYRRKLDGSAPFQLAPQDRMQLAPDWSPRGDAVAFESADIGVLSSRIWVADLGAGTSATLRQLTTLPGCASMPTFQPNGRGLAYTYIPNPNDPSPQCYLRWVSSDGTGDGQVAFLGGPTNFRRHPRWSADGKYIYFPVFEQGDRVVAFPAQGGAAVLVNKFGASTVGLDLHPGSGKALVESWLPVFNGAVATPLIGCSAPPPIAARRVALMDTLVSGSDLDFRVFAASTYAQQPAWAPEGTRIAYQLESRLTGDGSVEIRQVTWNHAPQWTAGADDQALTAGVPFQVNLQATDPDGEPITFKLDYLPPGATLHAGTTFRWLNPIVGEYFAVFRALDGSGGVAKRVVHISVASDGGSGDPFRDGDGGCPACLMSPVGEASLATSPDGGAATNSYLNGATPGAWFSSLSRVTLPRMDTAGNLVVTLTAPLPGTVSVDRVGLQVVDHAADEQAIALPDGIRVGNLEQVVSVRDAAGRELTAPLAMAQEAGEFLAITAGSLLTVRWAPDPAIAAVVLECAHTGEGWGEASGIEVQTGVDPEWQTVSRLSPRQNFDLIGASVGSASSVRLLFLADTRLRAVRVMRSSSAAPSITLLSPSSTDWPQGISVLSGRDGETATLARGSSITFAFAAMPPASGTLRSCFLQLNAAYTPPTGAWSARAQRQDEKPTPARFALLQNQPNPFAGATRMRFELPRRCRVQLEIFDAQGRRTRNLLDQVLAPGAYEVPWNAADASGRTVAPGVYLYSMRAGEFSAKRRLVLLPR